MPASFPGSIKTWTPVVDNVDDVLALHINDAYAEIIAVETQLSQITSSLGTATLTTTDQTVKGAINEIDAVLDGLADALDVIVGGA